MTAGAAAALGTWPDRHDSRTNERRRMNETCGRCGPAVPALYRVARRGELYLCGQCTRQPGPALSAQGWRTRRNEQSACPLMTTIAELGSFLASEQAAATRALPPSSDTNRLPMAPSGAADAAR